MGHISPAIRGLGRRRAPPPLPLLLPLLLLLLRAQLAVGSLAGGSPGAAEVRTGGWGKGRDPASTRRGRVLGGKCSLSSQVDPPVPGPLMALGIHEPRSPGPSLPSCVVPATTRPQHRN